MAEKIINFTYGNKDIAVTIGATIKREELYGKQSRIVEKDNKQLQKAILTPTGVLFPSSVFSSTRVDPNGSIIDAPTPKTLDGKEAAIFISSFKEARPLKKVEPSDIVDIAVEGVIPATQQDLENGFYETQYTYRDSTKLQEAVIIVNDKESFILVGERKETPLLGKGETYDFFEEENEEESSEDEVDFNMF